MPTDSKVRKIAKELDQNPVFALSRGSLELCMSNLLAWMLKDELLGPNLISGIVRAIDCGFTVPMKPVKKVKREHLHIDLLIQLRKNHWIAVENKIKASVDLGQLDSYAEALNNNPWFTKQKSAKILLTLASQPESCSDDWRNLTWSDIASWLPSGTKWDLLTDELKSLIESLKELRSHINLKLGSPLFRQEHNLVQKLQEFRLHDLASKWLYDELGQRIRESAKQVGIVVGTYSRFTGFEDLKPGEFLLEVGYTRAQGLVSLFKRLEDRQILAIQVQGGQYRKAVIVEDGGIGNSKIEARRRLETCPDKGSEGWGSFQTLKRSEGMLGEKASVKVERGREDEPWIGTFRDSMHSRTFYYTFIKAQEATPEQVIKTIMEDLK